MCQLAYYKGNFSHGVVRDVKNYLPCIILEVDGRLMCYHKPYGKLIGEEIKQCSLPDFPSQIKKWLIEIEQEVPKFRISKELAEYINWIQNPQDIWKKLKS